MVADAVISDLEQCQNFDLFQDHDSINQVFYLGCELLEQQQNGQYQHEGAAKRMLEQSGAIV